MYISCQFQFHHQCSCNSTRLEVACCSAANLALTSTSHETAHGIRIKSILKSFACANSYFICMFIYMTIYMISINSSLHTYMLFYVDTFHTVIPLDFWPNVSDVQSGAEVLPGRGKIHGNAMRREAKARSKVHHRCINKSWMFPHMSL